MRIKDLIGYIKMEERVSKSEIRKIYRKSMIYIDLFGIPVYFTKSKEEFTKMCIWSKLEPKTDVDGRAMYNINDDGTVMIYLGWFTDNVGTLAHECVHAAKYIADAIGHETSYSDEIVPYITGYLVSQCLDKVKAQDAVI